ncbi:MAG TPA: DMT family transporter [Anaerolineales bacterium]
MDTAAAHARPASGLNRGYLIAIIGTLIWSTTAIFIRYLTETYRIPPLVLAFWRDSFAALALAGAFLAVTPTRLRVSRKHLGFLAGYGLVLAVFNSLWTVSVALNGAAVSTVLAYSSAAFTAVLGWWFFHERLYPAKVVAVLLSLAGSAFVSGAYLPAAWGVNTLGILTGLLSGIGLSGYSLMGRASAQRSIDPWTALLYTFSFAAVFILAFNFIPTWPLGLNPAPNLAWLGNAWMGWLVLVLLAVGPTIGGYGLFTVSLTYLPASAANLIATLEPPMTALLAYLLLAERFSSPQMFGSALVIVGLIILRLFES